MLSIRPFEILTDPAPRMAMPSNTCGAAIVRTSEDLEWPISIHPQVPVTVL